MFIAPKTDDPALILRAIRERWPQADSKKLQAIYHSVVLEHGELHRAIIAQSFARALQTLDESPPPSR